MTGAERQAAFRTRQAAKHAKHHTALLEILDIVKNSTTTGGVKIRGIVEGALS